MNKALPPNGSEVNGSSNYGPNLNSMLRGKFKLTREQSEQIKDILVTTAKPYETSAVFAMIERRMYKAGGPVTTEREFEVWVMELPRKLAADMLEVLDGKARIVHQKKVKPQLLVNEIRKE